MRSRPGSILRALSPVALVALLTLSGVNAAALDLPFSLTGHGQWETLGYPDHKRSDHDDWENFFELETRMGGRLLDDLTFRFDTRIVADDTQYTAGFYSFRNDQRRRPYVEVITGALDYRPFDSVRITVGKQLVNWSVFDELQPANFSARDESDIFRRVDLGVYGVSTHVEHDWAYADLVVVPMAFQMTILPQGRWDLVGDEEGVNREFDTPPVRFEETQVAMRVGAQLDALDVSLIGYVGRDVFPAFVPELVFVGGDEVFRLDLKDAYARARNVGVTGTYLLTDALLLRTEMMYFTSPDSDRDDFLQSIIGAEYSWRDWRLVVNYFRDDRVIAADDEVTDKGERRFFQSFLYGEVRYDDGGDLEVRFRAGYDMTEDFYLIQPEVAYRVWGDLQVALTADIIGAKRGNGAGSQYFSDINHDDRIGTRLRYYF